MDEKHFYRVGSHSGAWDDLPTDPDELDTLTNSARQAEHLNLLLGSGFTTAVGYLAGVGATGMAKVTFGTTYDAAIDAHAPGRSDVRPQGKCHERRWRSPERRLRSLGADVAPLSISAQEFAFDHMARLLACVALRSRRCKPCCSKGKSCFPARFVVTHPHWVALGRTISRGHRHSGPTVDLGERSTAGAGIKHVLRADRRHNGGLTRWWGQFFMTQRGQFRMTLDNLQG